MTDVLKTLFDILKKNGFNKEAANILVIAEETSTSPLYTDEDGKEITPKDIIIDGKKPNGKLKGKSLADKVTSKDFGKI